MSLCTFRDGCTIYRATKSDKYFQEITGNSREICKYFKVREVNLSTIVSSGIIHGWNIKAIGTVRKIYEMYNNGEFIARSYVDDVSKFLGVSKSTVIQASKSNYKIKGTWTIKQNGYWIIDKDGNIID